jgi:hypothetical protein
LNKLNLNKEDQENGLELANDIAMMINVNVLCYVVGIDPIFKLDKGHEGKLQNVLKNWSIT